MYVHACVILCSVLNRLVACFRDICLGLCNVLENWHSPWMVLQPSYEDTEEDTNALLDLFALHSFGSVTLCNYLVGQQREHKQPTCGCDAQTFASCLALRSFCLNLHKFVEEGTCSSSARFARTRFVIVLGNRTENN